MTGMPAHGIAIIYTSRRFHTFMRRTTISHFSFLISHSIEAFKRNHGAPCPGGSPRTLNLFPITSIHTNRPYLFQNSIQRKIV